MATPNNNKVDNRGGKRAGAGRPRLASSIARDNEKVKNKVLPLAEAGIQVLAESYPMLMRRAIELALGNEALNRIPNAMLLKSLLEQLPRVVNLDDSNKPMAVVNIIQDHLDRVRNDANNPS